MMRFVVATALSLAAAAPAPAMTVAEFLGKVDGIYAKGPFALFSSDIRVVKAEGVASTEAWRAQAHAPNACPPSAPVRLGQSEYLAMLRAVPPAQRHQSVAQAVTTAMNRRYPCGPASG